MVLCEPARSDGEDEPTVSIAAAKLSQALIDFVSGLATRSRFAAGASSGCVLGEDFCPWTPITSRYRFTPWEGLDTPALGSEERP
jgi:hypothetical protein